MSPEPDLAADAAPEQMLARLNEQIAQAGGSLQGGHHHGGQGGVVSVRTVTHGSHEIVIRTRYEIEVDGRPFDPEVTVDLGGHVHYHGLPTRDFASMVDLVRKAIDTFPADFEAPAASDGDDPGPHGHDPGHQGQGGDSGGHGQGDDHGHDGHGGDSGHHGHGGDSGHHGQGGDSGHHGHGDDPGAGT